MYAIVEIAGQQFKVQKDQNVFVHRLDAEAGSKVEFDQVLLVEDKGKVNIGAPVIEGAKVTAEVLNHLKGDKVIVFKKKRRKGYRKKNGHRQLYTEISIKGINVKKEAAKKASAKAETPKKASAKKDATKKVAAKKETSKKASAKKEAK